MTFKDGDTYFKLRFDASSFVAYMATLGLDFTFRNGVVEFPESNLIDAVFYGVVSFGLSAEEHPNKNLVFLLTLYANHDGSLEKHGIEINKKRYAGCNDRIWR